MRPRNSRRSLALLLGYSLAGLIIFAMLFTVLQALGLLSLLSAGGGAGAPFQTNLRSEARRVGKECRL